MSKEQKVVTAVGVSANSSARWGRNTAKRIEKAMADAVLECNAEGISTEEKNSAIIRERMQSARQRVLQEIQAEREAALKPV